MPAFHEPVFFAQHRVAIKRPVLHEIGEQPALAPLLMDAVSLEDGFTGCIATERRGVLNDAAYRRAKRKFSGSKRGQRACGLFDPGQVFIAGWHAAIRAERAEKCPRRLFARRKASRPALQDRASGFMLQQHARQAGPERQID